MKQFDNDMAKDLARSLAEMQECLERFGKGGLNAIDSCSLEGGVQHKKILEYRDQAEIYFKDASAFIHSHIEEMNRACKDILNYDLKTQITKALDELSGVGKTKKIEGEAVTLDL